MILVLLFKSGRKVPVPLMELTVNVTLLPEDALTALIVPLALPVVVN